MLAASATWLTLPVLKLRYSLYFGPKGPAICLAQPVGLGVHMNGRQGPKVRQLGLVACKRPGLQPLQFIGFISPALRAGLGKLVGVAPKNEIAQLQNALARDGTSLTRWVTKVIATSNVGLSAQYLEKMLHSVGNAVRHFFGGFGNPTRQRGTVLGC